MLQLDKKNLPNAIQQVLDGLQDAVDKKTGFTAQVKEAQDLWKSKGGVQGKLAFIAIATELRGMCVYVNVCNYCEQNEANDIEHIYPKSFFPSYAFTWDNYILACKQCNTAYKLDKCFVLDANGDVHEVIRGEMPPHSIVAMVNPRIEDPNKFMWLDLQTRKFEIQDNLLPADYNKAERTLFILQLNNRDLLKEDRKSTAIYYYQRLELLTRMLDANSVTEIDALLTPHDDRIDNTLPLEQLKQNLKNSFKVHLTNFKHPSVWHSIKTIESKSTPKWKTLFDKIPEARTW
jgi:uncharacterized protein (TIGR02646 family)